MDSSTFRLADRAVTGNPGWAEQTPRAWHDGRSRAGVTLGPSRRRARRCRGARNDGDRKREQGASPTVGPAAARPLLRLLRHRARSAAVSGGRRFQSSPQAATYYGVSRPDTRFLLLAVRRRDATTLGLTPDSSSAVTAAIRKTTPARPRAVRPVQRHDNGHTSAARRLSAFMPDRHRRSVLARRCLKRLDTAAAESSQLSEQIPARGSCTRLSARRARGSPRFGSTAESRPRTTRTQRRPATGRSPAAAP